ncbi:MAG: ATP-binding protein [Clostridia bacterium]|nr:ATP-binding protein [Clostridia bacterium]
MTTGVKNKFNTEKTVLISGMVHLRMAAALISIMLGGIYLSIKNYAFFHISIELFMIITSLTIFIVAVNTYEISENGFFMFLGISFCSISGFFLMHILEANNVELIKGNSYNISTQFSVIAKFIESLSLLVIWLVHPGLIKKTISPRVVTYIYGIVSVFLLCLVYYGFFPDCLNEQKGPTLFKMVSEYIIIAVFALVLFALAKHHTNMNKRLFDYLIYSIIFKIASQIFFAIYLDNQDILSAIGHTMRFISVYFIYKAIIQTSLKRPYELLFNQLSHTNEELRQKAAQLELANIQLKEEMNGRRCMEEAFKESEVRYRRLIELLPDGIFVQSDFKFIYVNKAGAKFLGIDKPESLIGKNTIQYVGQECKKVAYERLEILHTQKNEVPLIERKFIREDGSSVFGEVASISFGSGDNSIVVSVVRDITERKCSEELKKNFHEKSRLLQEAVELDKLKTEFFSNISHELRTPLNIILCTLKMMELYIGRHVIEDEEGTIQRNIKLMKQNAYRLVRLVNNLIDSTKFSSGYYEVNVENYNIINLIEEITMSVKEFIENKGISLQFDTDLEERILACDIEKIERVMLNLLSNATKFTKPGGHICVNICNLEEKVIITVRDTGIGIPENKLDSIFERFRQVDKSLTRAYEGSGIGLSIVKSLVEMHNGKIFAKSILGKGSEFIIELPAVVLTKEQVTASVNERNSVLIKNHSEMANIEFSELPAGVNS